MVIALGGMDSVQRLETMREYGATALLCTPSYAIHLARVSPSRTGSRTALGDASRSVVCTGEPGASIAGGAPTGSRPAWGARCFDHAGLDRRSARSPIRATADGGIHLCEDEFVC